MVIDVVDELADRVATEAAQDLDLIDEVFTPVEETGELKVCSARCSLRIKNGSLRTR